MIMKPFSNKTLLAAVPVALLLAAGCVNQEEEQMPANLSRKVTFVASSPETKTAFGEPNGTTYPTLWTANDLTVALSQDYATPGEAEVIPSEDYRNCTFSYTPDEAASYTFYAMSPSSAATSISPSRKSWLVTIPATQTPLSGSPDESAQILAAASGTLYELPSELDIHFNHVTAYGKMTLKNLALDGATISSISLSSSTAIAGSWYYDIEEEALTVKDGSYSLSLNTSQTENIWFAWAPVDLSGTSLKIVVHTDKGDFSKTVTFPANRVLTAGKIASFGVNMNGIVAEEATNTVTETVFEKVTSVSSLAQGDEIILVNPATTPTAAMTASPASSGISSSPGFTVDSDGYIRLKNESSVAVYTIASRSGSSTVTLTLKTSDEGYYLYLNSSGSGSSATRTLALAQSSGTSWTTDFTNGQARLYARSGQTSYYTTYNSSTSRFNISSSSGYVGIYKKKLLDKEVAVSQDDPVTDYKEYGAYLVGDPMIYSPSTDQISREYDNGVVTFAILDPANDLFLEFSGIPANAALGDSFPLTVTRTEGVVSSSCGTFNVTVVKEEGSRLWLAEGSGNSFIVKR